MSQFDEYDEPDGLDEFDEDDEQADESVVIDCPECGQAVYEDAEQCPGCGRWLTDADRHGGPTAWVGRPTWWIVLGLLGMVATIVVLNFEFVLQLLW